ncbi:MAG: biliverdin-producing heme oxygenase [Candidatus Methylacidiphilales bacterium]
MFIQNLRASTADCHKQLELNNLSQALLSNNVNEAIYCSYLIQLYSFVKGFEQFVYPALFNHFLNINDRKKALFIEEDLKALDIAIDKGTLLDEAFFSNTYTDVYMAAGALYVLEGSTLGGQIIVKHLQKAMPTGFVSITYFSGYQQKTGGMWKEFLQQLTALPQSTQQEEQIIMGAITTFKIIDGLLSNNNEKNDSI